MNERERLIKLISAQFRELINDVDWNLADMIPVVADYLLKNGTIVPPVKVGGIAWVIYNKCVTPANVMAVYVDKSGGMYDLKILTEGLKSTINKDYTFDMVYTTKEEAEKALKGGEI
mgnify:CR=1 FL=1